MGTEEGPGADQSEGGVGTRSYYAHQREEPCLALSSAETKVRDEKNPSFM